jgi:predicted amidohydrolase
MEKLNRFGYQFKPDQTIWLFDAGAFGRIGICICYDFMDVERYIVYRGEVQHLFVLAYNRDIQSFYHLAETLSRAVFCNVAVCNTGFHGGSVTVSPFYEPTRRTLYRHEGKRLFTSQVVHLPVADLMQAQNGNDLGYLDETGKAERRFKSLPPGYRARVTLSSKTVRLNDRGKQS